MSLYADPQYFKEHNMALEAPEETPPYIEDIHSAFEYVIDGNKYNHLELLRKKA